MSQPEHPIIFGATGRVGSTAIKIALDRGLQVTAVVRDPARLTLAHERLHVVTADTLQAESVASALREGAEHGATAVIMTVGADPLKPRPWSRRR